MFKRFFRKLDAIVFSGFFERYSNQKNNANLLKLASINLDYNYTTFYQKNTANPISLLCDKYGSDKGSILEKGHPYGWPPHTYSDYYHLLFSSRRQHIKKVFECGLGTNNPNLLSSMGSMGKPGASLRVWRDYFPNAIIYGADIDKDILFAEERIKTFYIDQLDPVAIKECWSSINERDFDFIVDDGLHTFDAGLTLFVQSIDRLSIDGVYIIEDVAINDLIKYKKFFSNSEYEVDYVLMNRPDLPLSDNSLVVIRKRSI